MYYPRCLVYKRTHSNPFTGNEKYCSIPLKVTFAIRSPFPRSSVTVFKYTTKAISTWNEGGLKKSKAYNRIKIFHHKDRGSILLHNLTYNIILTAFIHCIKREKNPLVVQAASSVRNNIKRVINN